MGRDDGLPSRCWCRASRRCSTSTPAWSWYYDDDNYVALLHEFLDGKPKVQLVTEKAAKPRFAVAACEPNGAWLRLVVSGTAVVAEHRRSAKEDWQVVGRTELTRRRPGQVSASSAAGHRRTPSGSSASRTYRVVQLPK